jgi:hypothetical protein
MVIVIFHVASFNGKLLLQTQIPELLYESSCPEMTELPSVMALGGHGLTRATQPTPQSTSCYSIPSGPITSCTIHQAMRQTICLQILCHIDQ